MKEFIEIVKNLLANKRTRSIAILLLYIVFFIFVFAFINSASKPVIKDEDIISNKKIYRIEIEGLDHLIYEDNKIIYNGDVVDELPSNYNLNILMRSLIVLYNYPLNIFEIMLHLIEIEFQQNHNRFHCSYTHPSKYNDQIHE